MARNAPGSAATRRGLILVVLAAALWGTSGVATKTIYSLVEISPIAVAAFRLTFGAPVLLIAYRIMDGSGSLRIVRTDITWFLIAGATVGISQAFYFAAISQVGVAIATLVTICTAPVLVSLASSAFLGERPTRAIGAALVCALIGTVLLVGVGEAEAGLEGGTVLRGIVLALCAAVCFATFILASRRLASRYHPLWSITIAVSAGAVLLLLISAVTTSMTLRYPGPVWSLFLYLGLAPTALGYAFFYHGVQYTSASEASIASLIEPLTSTVLAVLIFGERLGPQGVLGAALLISAIAFLYWNGSARPDSPT